MNLKAVKKVNIGDQVYDQIKDQIISGSWASGEKIPSENQLMDIFGVSRGTVRQAIQKLSAVGLLETRRGEGSYVRQLGLTNYLQGAVPVAFLSVEELKEVFAFRYLFECGVAELAAENATESQLQKLEKNYKKMLQNLGNFEKYIAIDYEFHCLLGECTNNTLVCQMYKTIEDSLILSMKKMTEIIGYDHGKKYHGLILEAVQARDPERAREYMRRHIKETPVLSDYSLKVGNATK
ncbi:MAG: FadR family transcriptional regulator [Clostridium sp.]|nr:FadR family transcriptional regulator [Clostridium sp.]